MPKENSADETIAPLMETLVESLGFELVDLERAGSARRPILRLRIDRPESAPGEGVTLDDCVRVSRALEAELDDRPGLSDRYVLEVSSPGVERPLVRSRDFERFAGKDVAIVGRVPLAERGKKLEGVLVGREEIADEEHVVVRLADGEEVRIPRTDIKRVHLVFRWGAGESS